MLWSASRAAGCSLSSYLRGHPGPSAAPHLTGKDVFAALRQVIIHFGDIGWDAVDSSLNVNCFSPTTGLCFIRVARDPYRIPWGAVTPLSSIEGGTYIPNIIHVSGTIKHAQLTAIEHNRILIALFRARANTQFSSLLRDLHQSKFTICGLVPKFERGLS